jgi:adenine-specific DNA methylase
MKSNENFDNFKLPTQQYLGNKIKYIDFIKQNIPDDVSIICDAFSGSGIVSYELKKKYKILSNDILSSGYQITCGLIENNSTKLTENDLKNIVKINSKKKTFIEDNFTNLYYTQDECIFLDNLYSNIIETKNKYKKSIFFTAICRTLIRKILFAYFCHTKAIEYRNDEKRWKRNPAINRDIKEMFLEYVKEYNNCIFDNKKDNKAYNMDIFDFLDNINDNNTKIDLIYFDPPYGGTHCDYGSYYHFLETYIHYWEDTKLYNKTKQPKDKLKKSDFTKKKLDNVFIKLFEKSKNIKYWLISYNSKSIPNREDMILLIKKYKNNIVFNEYKLENNNGGMGLKKGSSEYLILCY